MQSPPLDLRELPDGRILAVGQRELAIGDGVRWELYQQEADNPDFVIQEIAVGPDGKLYTGLRDGFGRIDFTENGSWRIKHLAPLPQAKDRNWPIFSIATKTQGHWYWSSTSGPVMRWDLMGDPVIVAGSNMIDHIFALGKDLYISDSSQGIILRVAENKCSFLQTDPETNFKNTIVSSAPYDTNRLLVGTNGEGLKLFDGHKLTPFASSGILAEGRRINDLCLTQGGYYAAAVDTFGLVFLDQKGRIIQILDRREDHRLARITKLLCTQDGVLWGLCNEGVLRVEFPSRISRFEQLLDSGLSYVEPMRFHGKLWFLANGQVLRGVYSEENRLIALEKANPSGHFTFTLHAKGPHLLACTDEGIFEFIDDQWKCLLREPVNARILAQDPRGIDRWLYCSENEIGWIDFTQTPLSLERRPSPMLPSCYGSVQDAAGYVWLELGLGKIARVDPSAEEQTPEFFDNKNGIPDSWAALCLIDGVIKMNAANRILAYNQQRKLWEDDLPLLRRFPSLALSSGRPVIDAAGRLWISGTDKVRIISTHQATEPEELPSEFHPFNFVCETNGVVWMHDKRRFARYDPSFKNLQAQTVHAVITRVEVPTTGRTLFTPKGSLPQLSSNEDSLIAHFLAPGNSLGQRVSFEFKLEGLGDAWISTGSIGSAVFNRLKEGDYLLRVRPKVGDYFGKEASLRFSITPPWFRTSTAYAAYVILTLTALGLITYLPVQIERRQQAKLKALVSIRTRELKQTNEQLKVLFDEARLKAGALKESEDRYRRLSTELEHRVEQRTDELRQRIEEVEQLNSDLQTSHQETELSAARLQEVNANLMVANHELEAFSYSVSHDLRAPLRNITGFMELLGKRVRLLEEKESNRQLDIVVSEARRMGSLIDDLLTFSRIGRAEMKLQKVSIQELIAELQVEFTTDLRSRNIAWEIAEMPPVLGDRTLLRQVMANLLANAIKFTRKQSAPKIEIAANQTAASSRFATFFVRDNGVGFNPQYIAKLFRVFQRLHTPKDFEGTGIGLANVKRIISRHGGRVWAEGMVNKGACIYFTLKLYSETDKPTALTTNTDGAKL